MIPIHFLIGILPKTIRSGLMNMKEMPWHILIQPIPLWLNIRFLQEGYYGGNTSNSLKFTIDTRGSVWFTEWSENKIGVLQSNKITDLPLWLTVSKNKVILDTSSGSGDTLMIHLYPNSTYFEEQNKDNKPTPDVPVKITTATSITPSGKLWNITTNLDSDTIYFENDDSYEYTPYSIEMEVKPIKGLIPGNYTLTIGARYGSVSYSKIIDLVATN